VVLPLPGPGAENKVEIPSSTAPPPAVEPAASSSSSSESDGSYYEVFGMKVAKDDLVTIGLAIAISYGIRW
jgi:signal peptidase I